MRGRHLRLGARLRGYFLSGLIVVDPDALGAALRPGETLLVSVMHANNETGVVQPIEELRRRAQRAGALFHTDAVQSVGKLPVDVGPLGVDLLSLSGHKIYAPKGVGALYVRRGTRLHAQNTGGHQEGDRRGGTESVPNIVAIGAAAELAAANLPSESERLRRLRDRFEDSIGETIGEVVFNGSRELRVPNLSSISFGSIEGEGLLINLDMQGIAVSTGSACSSGTLEPSPVIRALGCGDELARGAVRFSFGRFNTDEDLERVLEVLPSAVDTLRRLAPAGRGRSA